MRDISSSGTSKARANCAAALLFSFVGRTTTYLDERPRMADGGAHMIFLAP